MKRVLFIITFFVFSLVSWGYDIAVENADGVTIYYNYINDGKELEVTSKASASNHNTYSGVVIIPEEVTFMNRTRKVTSIQYPAFYECTSLTSVVIPESVTSIGGNAFANCTGLTSISIPSSVTSLEGKAFYKCYGLTSVTIGNGVKSIGESAFESCFRLTSLTIGNSVSSIDNYAFKGCNSLTSVTIPNSVTNIGYEAFGNCTALTSLTIGNSVKSIGEKAFYGADLSEVISKIEHPFYINTNIFTTNTFYNASLYVPVGTIGNYKATEGWNKFLFIEEGSGNVPEKEKCATPTIAFKDGKLLFDCDTEGVTFVYIFKSASVENVEGNNVIIPNCYTVSVYAKKDGFENSDTVTQQIQVGGVTGDVNGDGVVDISDYVGVANIILTGKS